MSLRGIKLVTFDATNTLMKFRVPPLQHYAAVAREFGYSCDEEDLKSSFKDSYEYMNTNHPNFGIYGIEWREWWRRLVISTFRNKLPANADVNVIADRLIADFSTSKCWCLANGCERILTTIRKYGIALGVISNYDPCLYKVLESVNIINYFNFIVASYEAGYSKPEKQIFNIAVERSGLFLEPSEILHIGDDFKNDYEGAKAMGWHAILISDKKETNEAMSAAKNVFTDLEELSVAIENNKLIL